MLNEHYDVTTAAYAVGYESYLLFSDIKCFCKYSLQQVQQ